MRSTRPNDHEREMWVRNDEGLYNRWRSSRQSMRDFIRENREEIDEFIRRKVGGSRVAHVDETMHYRSMGLSGALGGMFGDGATDDEKYAEVDKLERDLLRYGAGQISGRVSYRCILWGSNDVPAIERTVKGDRELIVGSKGETFPSRERSIIWAKYDAKVRLGIIKAWSA